MFLIEQALLLLFIVFMTSPTKTALITGITGQDGSFLAELLLDKGYRVVGFARRDSWIRPHCSSHLKDRLEVFLGDMNEGVDIADAIQLAKPDEIYNLASQSRPGESWAKPAETLTINGLSVIRLFEAARHHCPTARIYHASSSEMFGSVRETPQDENTAFQPVNPYAASKVYAHQMAEIYRMTYGQNISCGILFNHESERRPLHFLPQKVAYGAACASLGIMNSDAANEMGRPIVEKGILSLGNLEIARDWGYAPDFVEAMWMMLQQGPGVFVIGTGKVHSLKELCAVAYGRVGLHWEDHVISDPLLVRPIEPGQPRACPKKAQEVLGWKPKTDFQTMIGRMVLSHVERLRNCPRSLG